MPKRRSPTPHTPPALSKRGPNLTATFAQRIGIQPDWRLLDPRHVVHRKHERWMETFCGLWVDRKLEQTLAPITCLWCLVDRHWYGPAEAPF